MLSLRELRHAARIIQVRLTGATLRRIVQPDEQKLILTFDTSLGKSNILFSSKPEYARVCIADPAEPTVSPGSFYEYVRAHLPGAAFAGTDISGNNRQLSLRLQQGSDAFLLVLSILGVRSNLYLLDGTGKLLHSMRPLDDTRRELKVGEPWRDPHGGTPDEGIDRWQDLPDDAYLNAIERDYDQLEQKREAELLVRRIEQAIKREEKFLERKTNNLQEDLGEAKRAETYRQKGELLKGALHAVHPGDASVATTDYQTGEIVEIPLDPRLSAAANLEAYFARYQKESRGVRMIEQQLAELGLACAELDSIRQQLDSMARCELPDIQALRRLEQLPTVRRLVQRRSPGRKPGTSPVQSSKKKVIPTRLLPKRYSTQDGLEIWVGRSDEGNDYLTMRLARGNDRFFHLEGYPGSHVVLRTEGRLDPPAKSVLDACELAVHFSKMKHAGNADVHMAQIKDVKKPKGAKPGLVYVRSGKTIHLRRDSKRLQSILASRLDS
jgi:predicted ribosome quality control (RQC) complex YloA/Tae2 family protein